METSTDSESVAAESGLSESESEDANILNVAELSPRGGFFSIV